MFSILKVRIGKYLDCQTTVHSLLAKPARANRMRYLCLSYGFPAIEGMVWRRKLLNHKVGRAAIRRSPGGRSGWTAADVLGSFIGRYRSSRAVAKGPRDSESIPPIARMLC